MLIKWHLAVFYLFAIFECIFNDVYFKIMLLVNNEGTFIYVYVTFFCCCALADSFKFNCCLWNIHSDFLTLLLSCPGGAGVREGGQPGSPAYEVHGEMWRKAASASYKMQVAWQRVLHTSWIMSSAGQRTYKELCKELPNSQPSQPEAGRRTCRADSDSSCSVTRKCFLLLALWV